MHRGMIVYPGSHGTQCSWIWLELRSNGRVVGDKWKGSSRLYCESSWMLAKFTVHMFLFVKNVNLTILRSGCLKPTKYLVLSRKILNYPLPENK